MVMVCDAVDLSAAWSKTPPPLSEFCPIQVDRIGECSGVTRIRLAIFRNNSMISTGKIEQGCWQKKVGQAKCLPYPKPKMVFGNWLLGIHFQVGDIHKVSGYALFLGRENQGALIPKSHRYQ